MNFWRARAGQGSVDCALTPASMKMTSSCASKLLERSLSVKPRISSATLRPFKDYKIARQAKYSHLFSLIVFGNLFQLAMVEHLDFKVPHHLRLSLARKRNPKSVQLSMHWCIDVGESSVTTVTKQRNAARFRSTSLQLQEIV